MKRFGHPGVPGFDADGPRRGRTFRPVGSRVKVGIVFALLTLLLASPLLAQQSDPVRVYGEATEEGDYRFYADNNQIIPMWINVEFRSLTNLDSNVELPFRRTIEAGREREFLFTLEVQNERARRGYSLSYSFAYGDPTTATHDDDHLYLFPFGHGTKHRVTQGFNGEFSHFGENQYGVDFDLDIGDPIYAARDGLVVEVKDDSNTGGPSMSFAEYGNRIVVRHDDGSFGNYVHLMQGGADVAVGERVEAGERIGRSGATGLASGPHLHFDVRLPEEDGGMQSIPMRFRNHRGDAVTPREGAFYYASHPGGEPFEAVFGEDLRAEDFADHSAEVSRTNRLSVRNEQVDLAFVIYLANGYDEEREVEVDFRLAGMRPTTELPIVRTIPPLTEVFITILRADPDARQWQFAPVVRFR
ncbi:MAG: M23 family metallopeptidase [Alkalispirochaetaceae bacterium]